MESWLYGILLISENRGKQCQNVRTDYYRPYLDGPKLELLDLSDNTTIRFYWLIPIAEAEVIYKKEAGIEKLEEIFDLKEFNYIDPFRDSLI